MDIIYLPPKDAHKPRFCTCINFLSYYWEDDTDIINYLTGVRREIVD